MNPEIVSQLEKSGLIEKTSGHSNRYTLSQEYHSLVNDGLKIGKRYIVKEIELLLIALQGNALETGDLEEILRDALSRNQINYLKRKLLEDQVLKVEGRIKGARYSVVDKYNALRGDVLLNAVIAELRGKYE
ncbi:MAG TPA: hypothetical protein VL053_07345 [Arachidicoccus sp.]|nr:hypothetical protein [Arachidicoccus sp.]